MSAIEMWAGAECTVNRVGARYFDQLRRTGHHHRPEDMDRYAELGATAVRFPVLWERVAPDGLASADFSWSDVRLERLRELGIRPIVGLLHHGSGPPETDLCDPLFPEKLARYARVVAERYPWVEAYTPVNEPLTTARFSALYGHWYPHRRDTASFLKALVNQVVGTVLAMRAIRSVNPRAALYQTEDAGHTDATERLAYQARYENERRWLSLDLLFGRVDRDHPLRRHLEEHAVPTRTLETLVSEPCPPDLIGVNYYLTSDRFLDHRIERYPRHTWGGNGREAYADVEAVRVSSSGLVGHETMLRRTFERYGRPCALTEVHAGCHREQQLRWLLEAWTGAREAQRSGVDVRAVTLWAVFGSIDWSSLLTEERGDYESGAFDVRSSVPRKTLLFDLARAIGSGQRPELPVWQGSGWWRSPKRLLYPPVDPPPGSAVRPVPTRPSSPPVREFQPPLLVVGRDELARRIVEVCRDRGIACELVPHADLETVRPRVLARRPWGVAIDARTLEAFRCTGEEPLARVLDRLRLLVYFRRSVNSGRYQRRRIDAAIDRLMDCEKGAELWI